MRKKIAQKQYRKIDPYLPKPRGNFAIEHLKVLNAIRFPKTIANSALPRRYGRWNTAYRRVRRRAENDVLPQTLETLQKEGTIGGDFSVLSLDSTFVKSSPSAAEL